MQQLLRSKHRNMDLDNPKQSPYEQSRNAKDVVSLVDDILSKAVESGASDVHFEPMEAELA